MRQAVVRDVYQWLDEIAPFETAEAFDNVGLLIGSMRQKVNNVLVALDVTLPVIQQAIEKNVQLIITHHPVMFRPVQQIVEDTYEGKLLSAIIRAGISLISTHTNIDQTPYSGSARLAEKLGLIDIVRPEPYLFIGTVPEAIDAQKMEGKLEEILGTKVIRYGNPDTIIQRLAIAGGAYDEGYEQAQQSGAQALLTGEVKHHNAIAAVESGMILFEGGHLQTETPMVSFLAECLQNALNTLEYNVRVYSSDVKLY